MDFISRQKSNELDTIAIITLQNKYNDDASQQGQLHPKLMAKLENAVSKFPEPLQESFVKRIVEKIVSPNAYKKYVDAVFALAMAAGDRGSESDHDLQP